MGKIFALTVFVMCLISVLSLQVESFEEGKPKKCKALQHKKGNSHVKDSNPCHVKPLNARLPSKPTKKEVSNPLLKLAEKRRLTSKNPFWLNGNVKFLTNDLNKNF